MACGLHRSPGRLRSRLLCRASHLGWVVALVVMAVLATTADAARGQAAIEPPLVVDGGATDGQVRLEPAAQTVVDGRVVWLLTNGGEDPLHFEVSVHRVVATDDGIEVGGRHPDLQLAVERLRLAPGEVARVPLHVPEDVGRPFALVARTVDSRPETTLSAVALRTADVEVTPTVTAADAMAGTFTVRLDAQGPSLVDVAMRTSAWPGVGRSDTVVEGVLVPAGGRDLQVELGGMLAGRVRLEVAVASATQPAATDAQARTSTSVWWWPPVSLVALAILAVVVAVLLAVARQRRGQV